MDFSTVFTADQLPVLAFTTTTIIGIVNTIQMQFPKVTGIYGVIVGCAIGLIGGFFGLYGLTIELGLTAGFASSGIYKLATKAGGN